MADDEDLTPEELAAYEEHMGSEVAPPDDEGEAPAQPETKEPDPAESQPEQPAAEPAPETDEAAYQAFLDTHKGKSPEELARLAFQQSKRANAEAFRGRKTQEQIDAIRDNAARALAERRQSIAERREAFKARLAEDPDAATADLHEQLLSQEEREAEIEAMVVRRDAAIELAASAIPDFYSKAEAVHQFGFEMNYTEQELNNISDGRDLVTLYLASITGRLIKAGMMDINGNFTQMPNAVAEDPTDPRLRAPAPVRTLSSAPARSAGKPQSIDQQLADVLNMSDADFAKMSEADLENLLRAAG